VTFAEKPDSFAEAVRGFVSASVSVGGKTKRPGTIRNVRYRTGLGAPYRHLGGRLRTGAAVGATMVSRAA
jgi:hypothetical protein